MSPPIRPGSLRASWDYGDSRGNREIACEYADDGRIVWRGSRLEHIRRSRGRALRHERDVAVSYHVLDRHWRVIREWSFHAHHCNCYSWTRSLCVCGLREQR